MRFRLLSPMIARVLVAGSAILAMYPAAAHADDWRFGADLHGWFPDVTGDLTIPHARLPDGTRQDVDVSADEILDARHLAFLGGLRVNRGRWGAFTDLIYMDLDGSDSQSLPGGSGQRLDADLAVQATVWTLAGQYRVLDDPRIAVDALLGFRYLALDLSLDLGIDGPLPIDLPVAHLGMDPRLLDGILGVRGEVRLGGNWFMPYYLDVGTGGSTRTWQAQAGIGYRFAWGDALLGYRHLDYTFDEGDAADLDFAFSGPSAGVSLRF